MTEQDFTRILGIAEKLKCNTRHSFTSTGRKESVAEHSWRLSLMVLLLEDALFELDTEKILKMAILHDLGEAITGDIPSFLKTDAHRQTEFQEIETLFAGLPKEWQDKFFPLFLEMEEKKTPEAKALKALDKLEAVIQHNEATIDTWLPLEYELQQTYGAAEAAQTVPIIQELRKKALQDTLEKIKNQGKLEENP